MAGNPILPKDLLEKMKIAAREAGAHALAIQMDKKENSLKEDDSIVTKGDTEGEAIIRQHLSHYGFSILGEEQGYTPGRGEYSIIIDPIDGTTNYAIGDPSWMVSIGVMQGDEAVAGVAYQPVLDKLYYAEKGKGAFLEQRGICRPLHIPPLTATTPVVIDTLFARHPNFERQGVLYGRTYEDAPDIAEALVGKKITAKYRTTGCPSVPLCNLADGVRTALIAKPVKLWDVAAGLIIAKEAGADIHFAPETPEKSGLSDWHMMVASIPELFQPLMHIFESTISKRAKVYNALSDTQAVQHLKEDGISYGVTVGRRQPMHNVHVDCIKEIAQAGLHPVIIIGSNNAPSSPYYDPLRNPLTESQQRQQIKHVMEREGITDYTVLALNDRGHMQHWVSSLRWELQKAGIKSNQAVMHFRRKVADKEQLEGGIKPLSAYQETMSDYGLAVWESVNRRPEHDQVSASPYRIMDVESEAFHGTQSSLADPTYIQDMAQSARARNPDKAMLEGIPVTMLDLTLDRLREEKTLSTRELLNDHAPENMGALQRAIEQALSLPSAGITSALRLDAINSLEATKGAYPNK